MLRLENVIQGLIAIKGFKAKGFFKNLRMRTREKEKKKKKTLLLRAPLVAIGAQKALYQDCFH